MPPEKPPGEAAAIQQISASELKALIDSGAEFEFVDVRSPGERQLACINGSHLLDEEHYRRLIAKDRSTPLIFQCHHGIRSQAAAEHFLELGFTNLRNLRGGIEAWSREIDPTVPRY
jgi:monothiol glutaredoxin